MQKTNNPYRAMYVACADEDVLQYWKLYAVAHSGEEFKYSRWGNPESSPYYYANPSVEEYVRSRSTPAFKHALDRNGYEPSLEAFMKDALALGTIDPFKYVLMADWLVYKIDGSGAVEGKPFPLGNLLKDHP